MPHSTREAVPLEARIFLASLVEVEVGSVVAVLPQLPAAQQDKRWARSTEAREAGW